MESGKIKSDYTGIHISNKNRVTKRGKNDKMKSDEPEMPVHQQSQRGTGSQRAINRHAVPGHDFSGLARADET